MPPAQSPARTGVLAAVFAYLTWGLTPIYWKAASAVPALEILSHRIVWSVVFVGLVLAVTGRFGEVRGAASSWRNVRLLLLSSVLVSVNWFSYIYAVNTDRVLEASMGYYINPLVNVLLGFVFYRERLRPLQLLAVGLAALGVANMVWDYGEMPWLSLILAFSFGLYALVRKKVEVEALPGLFFETALLGAVAGGYLLWLGLHGTGALGRLGPGVDALLLCAGALTSIPLLLFTFGARRLSMATLGILQYMAPTCMFLLGVFAYGEPFTATHRVTFMLIWAGVGVYAFEGATSARRHSRSMRVAGGWRKG